MKGIKFYHVLSIALLFTPSTLTAQTKAQQGVVRMITHSSADPIKPVQGVQVVVGGVAHKASNAQGRFTMNVAVNKEHSYQVEDVRLPQGSKLLLASPSRKKKLFLDRNDLEVALITAGEKNTISQAEYNKLKRKYDKKADELRSMRNQLEDRQAEIEQNSSEYAKLDAKRDSIQKLLNFYYDEKTYKHTLEELQNIADELALTDYQSLDSIEAHIYRLKMEGEWEIISSVLAEVMGNDAATWISEKVERRNRAAEDFERGMEMIKEAITAFKMQHLNDSVSYYYDILVKADTTNWDNITQSANFEWLYRSNFSKALQLYQLAQRHAEDDFHKADSYNSMANIYLEKDEFQNAMDCYNASMELQARYDYKTEIGAESMQGFADICAEKGEYKQALVWYNKALDIYLKLYGEKNSDVASCYNSMALIYSDLEDYDKSAEYFQNAINITKELYGEKSIKYADMSSNFGDLMIEIWFHPLDGLGLLEAALAIYKENFGTFHPSVATCYNSIGRCYAAFHNLEAARKCFEIALNIAIGVYGEHHTAVATYYHNLGDIYRFQDDYDNAVKCYQNSVNIAAPLLGEEHPTLVRTYHNLGLVFRDKEIYDVSILYMQMAEDIAKKNHMDTKEISYDIKLTKKRQKFVQKNVEE